MPATNPILTAAASQPPETSRFVPLRIDDTAAKPRQADWHAELASIRRLTKAVMDTGLKQHGEQPHRVASDIIASVADAVLERLSAHPDGDLSEEGIHAVVTAAVDTAGQYDQNDAGLAVMAALD